MRGGTSAAREGFVGARQEGTMPEVQFARARKQQRGRDGVAPFMDAAVVVIPRRAGSFRGPGGGGGDPATAARTTEAPRRDAASARAVATGTSCANLGAGDSTATPVVRRRAASPARRTVCMGLVAVGIPCALVAISACHPRAGASAHHRRTQNRKYSLRAPGATVLPSPAQI